MVCVINTIIGLEQSIHFVSILKKTQIYNDYALHITLFQLLTYENLYKRKIMTESWCPRCKLHCEATMHALVKCGCAKKI